MPELSPADIEFIKDLREAREDERISRRDLMTLLGGGVVGAATGGGGLAATGLASADASTSDSDGNVGLPGDRVDVFADGVDAAVVDTEEVNDVLYASENLSSLPSISSALDTAETNAPATVAVVDPGTHVVSIVEQSSALFWNTSGVSLHLGPGVTVKMADGEHSSAEGHVVRIGDGATSLSNVGVFGEGTIDGNKANNSSSTPLNGASVFVSGPVASPEVKDITVANSPGDAVLTEGASGSEQTEVRITNVTVDACAEGILGEYADGWYVRNCTIESTTVQDGIEPASGITNFEIDGNVVRSTAQQGIDVFGGASDGDISNNIIRGTTGMAIHLSDQSNKSSGITIRGNDIDMAGNHDGFEVASGPGHEDIEFVGNTVRNAVQPFNIAAGSGAPDSVSVDDNRFVDCTDQATLGDGTDLAVSENLFRNCNPSGTRVLLVQSATTVRIRSNELVHVDANPPGEAINLNSTGSGYTSENVILGYTTAITDNSAAGHTVTNNHV